MKLLLLMFLCHLLDDFYFQVKCLSNLKQKSFWINFDKKYKYDYIIALFNHSLEWSLMISLPLILLSNINIHYIGISIIINTIVHAVVDDLKANKFKLNLIQDQLIHYLQIIITYLIII